MEIISVYNTPIKLEKGDLTPVDKTGQGYLFDPGDEVKKDETTKTNDPFNTLIGNIKNIIERELKNKASCVGMFAEIAGHFGFDGIKELGQDKKAWLKKTKEYKLARLDPCIIYESTP